MLHRLPGRIRFRIPGLYRNPLNKERLEQRLKVFAGVYQVSANVLTGNLLVVFDAAMAMTTVEAWVHQAARKPESGSSPAPESGREPWHCLDPDEVLRYWHSSPQDGLEAETVRQRQLEMGLNRLPVPQRRSALITFSDQFKSLPVALLGASAVLSLLTGGTVDAAVIVGCRPGQHRHRL